jgi:cytidylate kinase
MSRPETSTQRVEPLVIAVDGPAASGKGTLSRRLATHYGLAYLDTGALYRAVAAALLASGKIMNDEKAAEAAARRLDIAAIEENVIRAAGIGEAASVVATFSSVRAALAVQQREFARRSSGALLDGRDIGTVICPQAQIKFFVTASAQVRAHRRFLELVAADPAIREGDVLADILARDKRDMDRQMSPLTMAPDAHLLDTTELDIEAAFKTAAAIVDQALLRA